MSAVLEARGLSAQLGARRVVADVSLTLRRGELTALVGPNGAGKTTLMRALAGLIPSEGEIVLAGAPLRALGARERAKLIAYLPQGHVFHWPITAEAVVALGRHPHLDAFSTLAPADRAAIARAMAATGMQDFAARPVTTLSGGERARVALARALATEATILLADEPTAALDPRHQLVVMDLLRQAARGGGVLAIVHDLTLAARYADRVVVMEGGRVIADAAPESALSDRLMAEVFGVETLRLEADGRPIPMPRRPV